MGHGPGCQLHKLPWEVLGAIIHVNCSYLGYFQLHFLVLLVTVLGYVVCMIKWIYPGANEAQASDPHSHKDPSKA